MSRALVNKKRSQRATTPLPPISAPAHAQNVASYDGRTGRGHNDPNYERRAEMQDQQGDGHVVYWKKSAP